MTLPVIGAGFGRTGTVSLSRFLGAAVPDSPFPKANSTRDFQAMAAERFKPA